MSLSEIAPGQFRLSGIINFATSPDTEQRGSTLLLASDSAQWIVDMAGITQADSSALAVCLAWLRLARANRKTVTFTAAPRELSALAQVCGVAELLGISGQTAQRSGLALNSTEGQAPFICEGHKS